MLSFSDLFHLAYPQDQPKVLQMAESASIYDK